jgi:hypothetical protein
VFGNGDKIEKHGPSGRVADNLDESKAAFLGGVGERGLDRRRARAESSGCR